MPTVQHYIEGDHDDSFAKLARIYGIPWKGIATATFGTWKSRQIYPWLRDNGGFKGAADPKASTGYNWFFAPGMVVNIPGVLVSKSPITASIYPAPWPGGPLVNVYGYRGAALPPAEPAVVPGGSDLPDQDSAGADDDWVSTVVSEPTPGVMKAGVGGAFGWLIVAAGLYWLYTEYGGKKKKTTRKRKRKTTKRRRKTTRRRRRR